MLGRVQSATRALRGSDTLYLDFIGKNSFYAFLARQLPHGEEDVTVFSISGDHYEVGTRRDESADPPLTRLAVTQRRKARLAARAPIVQPFAPIGRLPAVQNIRDSSPVVSATEWAIYVTHPHASKNRLQPRIKRFGSPVRLTGHIPLCSENGHFNELIGGKGAAAHIDAGIEATDVLDSDPDSLAEGHKGNRATVILSAS